MGANVAATRSKSKLCSTGLCIMVLFMWLIFVSGTAISQMLMLPNVTPWVCLGLVVAAYCVALTSGIVVPALMRWMQEFGWQLGVYFLALYYYIQGVTWNDTYMDSSLFGCRDWTSTNSRLCLPDTSEIQLRCGPMIISTQATLST